MAWGPPGSKPGICRVCGDVARKSNAFYCEEHVGMIGKKADDPVMAEATESTLFGEEQAPRAPSSPSVTEEAQGKVRQLFAGARSNKVKPEAAPGTKETRPKVVHRRESLTDLLGLGWGGIGTALARGPDIPVGRAMQAQSPVAGEILDQAIKGTVVDKLLQPIARKADSAQALFGLLGVPILVGALERRPELAPTLGPLLYSAVETWVVEMAPIMRKRQARADKVRKTLQDAFPDLPEGVDPVAQMIEAFFAPPENADVPRETEEKVPA
jgi:hypothetical protein